MTPTPIRCPHDHKRWFDATPGEGLTIIKCQGKCRSVWQLRWVDNQPVIQTADKNQAT